MGRDEREGVYGVPGSTIPGPLPNMQFAYIPAGEFLMGLPENNWQRVTDNEQHRVVISKSFYMQTTVVTQSQWEAVMGSNPSVFKGSDLPVEYVSWVDVQDFIRKLNRLDPGKSYRLPTEAEWEYACRAGTNGSFNLEPEDPESEVMIWCIDNSGRSTHNVGQLQENSWGLHDMHGNVWEWCADWYDKDYYKNSPSLDPSGPSTGEYRVIRGGSWLSYIGYCTSDLRNCEDPSTHRFYTGFRLVRDVTT